jgi:hypothetical protein
MNTTIGRFFESKVDEGHTALDQRYEEDGYLFFRGALDSRTSRGPGTPSRLSSSGSGLLRLASQSPYGPACPTVRSTLTRCWGPRH